MTRIALGCGLCLAAIVAAATLGAAAQQASPATTAHAALVEDLVAANRALVQQGVLDAWGHASARDDRNPNRYLLSRSLAPALVTADDIMEYDLNSNPLDQRGRVMYERTEVDAESSLARFPASRYVGMLRIAAGCPARPGHGAALRGKPSLPGADGTGCVLRGATKNVSVRPELRFRTPPVTGMRSSGGCPARPRRCDFRAGPYPMPSPALTPLWPTRLLAVLAPVVRLMLAPSAED